MACGKAGGVHLRRDIGRGPRLPRLSSPQPSTFLRALGQRDGSGVSTVAEGPRPLRPRAGPAETRMAIMISPTFPRTQGTLSRETYLTLLLLALVEQAGGELHL